MGKKFDVYKLQLPVFNMSSLRVIHEDHRTYASDVDVRPKKTIERVFLIHPPPLLFLISHLSDDKTIHHDFDLVSFVISY